MDKPEFRLLPACCPVCGESEHTPLETHRLTRRIQHPQLTALCDHDFSFVRCSSCQHKYMNPAPDEESLKNFYVEDYFEQDASSGYNADVNLSASDTFYFKTCRSLPLPSGRLLEIGPGNRKYLTWAKRQGYDVHGYDYGEYPCCEEAKSIPMQYGEFTESQDDERYDMICMWWVLEHVKNAKEIAQKCFDKLEPGGYFLYTVPNAGCPDAKVWGDYWHHLVIPDHISQFDENSAKHLSTQVGFRIEKVKHDVLSFDTLLSAWDLFYYRFGISTPLQSNLAKVMCLPSGWIKSWLRISGNVTVWAQKPL